MRYCIIIVVLFEIFLYSCNTEQAPKDSLTPDESEAVVREPELIHTVYFWTKEGTSKEQLEHFEAGLIQLGSCPQIQKYFWGPPAPTQQRGVIDNSYAYAINVHFASVADEKAYQEEPLHLKFISDHQAIWEKVIVYDNLVK